MELGVLVAHFVRAYGFARLHAFSEAAACATTARAESAFFPANNRRRPAQTGCPIFCGPRVGRVDRREELQESGSTQRRDTGQIDGSGDHNAPHRGDQQTDHGFIPNLALHDDRQFSGPCDAENQPRRPVENGVDRRCREQHRRYRDEERMLNIHADCTEAQWTGRNGSTSSSPDAQRWPPIQCFVGTRCHPSLALIQRSKPSWNTISKIAPYSNAPMSQRRPAGRRAPR